MEGIIYRRTAPNGKIYIGQTINERRRQHEWFYKRNYSGGSNPHLEAARKKYGPDSFSYTVLERFTGAGNEVAERLNEREIYWIAYYKSNDRRKGYNLTVGGGGCNGYRHTEESRRKISVAHKGVKRAKKENKYTRYGLVNEYNEYGDMTRTGYIADFVSGGRAGYKILASCQQGCWLGYRTYRFASIALASVEPLVARKKKQADLAKIDIYSVETGTLKQSFRFIRDCAAYLNGRERGISQCLRGKKLQYKGYVIVKHGCKAIIDGKVKQAYEWYKLYGRPQTQ